MQFYSEKSSSPEKIMAIVRVWWQQQQILAKAIFTEQSIQISQQNVRLKRCFGIRTLIDKLLG